MKLLLAIFLIWPLHAFSQAEPPLPANRAGECIQAVDVCAIKALLRLISEVESVNTCDYEAIKEYFSASSYPAVEKGAGPRPLPMVPIVMTTRNARPGRCMLVLRTHTEPVVENEKRLIQVGLDDLKSQIALCYTGMGQSSHGLPLISYKWCGIGSGGKSTLFAFRGGFLESIVIFWEE